jgi:hypothetical protein
MITPLHNFLGPVKTGKVVPKTKLVPYSQFSFDSDAPEYTGTILFQGHDFSLIPLSSESYVLPKGHSGKIITSEMITGWEYILKKLDETTAKLLSFMGGLYDYMQVKVAETFTEEQVIENRYKKLKEKILDRTYEAEEKKTPKKEKLEILKKLLMGAAATATAVTVGKSILSGNIKQKAAQLTKKLMADLGLTDVQAAGIVANLLNEGFGKGIPDDIQDGTYSRETGPPPDYGTIGVGYGWAQWTNSAPGDRLDKFIMRLGGGPGKQARAATDSDNYEYLLDDFRTGYASVLNKLKNTTNIVDATSIILKEYERPANQSSAVVNKRAADGNAILEEVRKNASGAIVIPRAPRQEELQYINTPLDDFIVEKPTIIDVSQVGEPLIIIPLTRPIGQSILKTLFEEPFRKIEKTLEIRKEKKVSKGITSVTDNKPKSSISTSTLSDNKIDIVDTQQYLSEGETSFNYNDIIKTESISDIILPKQQDYITPKVDQKLNFEPPAEAKISNIDTIQKTIKKPSKVLIFTQDIIVN